MQDESRNGRINIPARSRRFQCSGPTPPDANLHDKGREWPIAGAITHRDIIPAFWRNPRGKRERDRESRVICTNYSHTGSAPLSDFVGMGMMMRLNNAAKDNATPAAVSTSKGKFNYEEMGVGRSGGGREARYNYAALCSHCPTHLEIHPSCQCQHPC